MLIEVSDNAVAAHARHQDRRDIIPAPDGATKGSDCQPPAGSPPQQSPPVTTTVTVPGPTVTVAGPERVVTKVVYVDRPAKAVVKTKVVYRTKVKTKVVKVVKIKRSIKRVVRIRRVEICTGKPVVRGNG